MATRVLGSSNLSNGSDSLDAYDTHDSQTGVVLFLFVAFAVGGELMELRLINSAVILLPSLNIIINAINGFLFKTAAVRHLLKHTPLPYTVILIVIGLITGALPKLRRLEFLQDYLKIAQMDPHLMLIIFLPTLIFESAFVMDAHTFKKTIVQSIILAGPGLLISTFLTAVMGRFIFTYNWSWVVALMFGTIMSATDPVAVVALLKELGQ